MGWFARLPKAGIPEGKRERAGYRSLRRKKKRRHPVRFGFGVPLWPEERGHRGGRKQSEVRGQGDWKDAPGRGELGSPADRGGEGAFSRGDGELPVIPTVAAAAAA